MTNLKYLNPETKINIIGKVVDDQADYHIMGKVSDDEYICIMSVSHKSLISDDEE